MRAGSDVFTFVPDAEDLELPSPEELDRAFAVFDDEGTIVATGVNNTQRLTMPGGARIDVAGVAFVTVHQLHRRRGLLTMMMNRLIEDARSRGELASTLTASEGAIYWKQGFGPATWAMSGDISRGSKLFGAAPTSGSLRQIVDADLAIETMQRIHERTCEARDGAMSRMAGDWQHFFRSGTRSQQHWRLIVHVDDAGSEDGYAFYGVKGGWTPQQISEEVLHLHDLQTVNSEAHRALWTHLLDVDLSVAVRVFRYPAADPIFAMLEDPRAIRYSGYQDRLWVRPIDAVVLLQSRTFGSGEPVIFKVIDAGSTVTIRLTSDGATQVDVGSVVGSPDAVMSGAALGALSLGGTSASAYCQAGRIEELTPGAGGRLDQLLMTSPGPWMHTSF
jgi:predicted acetyltransferase